MVGRCCVEDVVDRKGEPLFVGGLRSRGRTVGDLLGVALEVRDEEAPVRAAWAYGLGWELEAPRARAHTEVVGVARRVEVREVVVAVEVRVGRDDEDVLRVEIGDAGDLEVQSLECPVGEERVGVVL